MREIHITPGQHIDDAIGVLLREAPAYCVFNGTFLDARIGEEGSVVRERYYSTRERQHAIPKPAVETKGLNELRDEAERIGREHGFTESTFAEDLALIHSELSEALEDFRKGHKPDEVWYEEKLERRTHETGEGLEVWGRVARHSEFYPRNAASTDFDRDHPYKPCGIPSELADVIIRVLHLAGKHRVDIEKAVLEKMTYNDKRPYKHGKVM